MIFENDSKVGFFILSLHSESLIIGCQLCPNQNSYNRIASVNKTFTKVKIKSIKDCH